MKTRILLALLVGVGLAPGVRMDAQSQPAPSPQSQPQNAPADQQKPASKPAEANPFPDDTTNVPVMPNSTAPGAPDPSYGSGDVHAPAADNDPVRSPDDPAPDPSAGSDSSSSSAALDKLLPPPDTGPSGRKGNKAQEPEHSESAKEDENVGTYYLSEKNWKAALSRFESAVVLDPENPEVYWGMAEAQRHLGNFTAAKANYLKLIDYDPDSKHGKEARKMLKDPELANAPVASAAKP